MIDIGVFIIVNRKIVNGAQNDPLVNIANLMLVLNMLNRTGKKSSLEAQNATK